MTLGDAKSGCDIDRTYVLIRDWHSELPGVRRTGPTGHKILFLLISLPLVKSFMSNRASYRDSLPVPHCPKLQSMKSSNASHCQRRRRSSSSALPRMILAFRPISIWSKLWPFTRNLSEPQSPPSAWNKLDLKVPEKSSRSGIEVEYSVGATTCLCQ